MDENNDGKFIGRSSEKIAKMIDEALIRRASMGVISVGAEDEMPARMTLTDIVLHAGAVVASTMAGITGEYGNLGGYQGIYHRLEMGLAKLRSK